MIKTLKIKIPVYYRIPHDKAIAECRDRICNLYPEAVSVQFTMSEPSPILFDETEVYYFEVEL